MMTGKKPAPMKARKDVGEVVFPIEKLTAARAASFSCVHIEAAFEAEARSTDPVKNRPRSAAKTKDPK